LSENNDHGAPVKTEAGLEVARPARLPATVPQTEQVPAIVEHRPLSRGWVWTRRLVLLALVGGGAGFAFWQAHRAPAIPAWIVYGNGRLEADPIDISTKFAGRIAELLADEGAKVAAGQIVAVMDTRDLAQTLQKQQAQFQQAQKAVEEAQATLEQTRSSTLLAQQQMERAEKLLASGFATRETYDQRKQALNSTRAIQIAAEHRVNEAQNALKAAQHDFQLTQVNIDDNKLVAPRDGRIEYRLANIGEVLAAGGKVFTMLDTSYVYMDVYLPTLAADKVNVGADARILLDAFQDRPIPAKVSFLANQAQFTPKMVETKNDRDKLMFRVRVKIDSGLARAHAEEVRSGLPGVAYVKTDAAQAWPASLQGKALEGTAPPKNAPQDRKE
jgi:HlyD family secretion protein